MNAEQIARRRREVRWAAWLIDVEEAKAINDVEKMVQRMYALAIDRPDHLQSGDTNLLTGVTIR